MEGTRVPICFLSLPFVSSELLIIWRSVSLSVTSKRENLSVINLDLTQLESIFLMANCCSVKVNVALKVMNDAMSTMLVLLIQSSFDDQGRGEIVKEKGSVCHSIIIPCKMKQHRHLQN